MDTLKPSASPDTTDGRSPGLQRHEVVLLATAPIVLALGRLLLVPYDDQEWNRMLGDMAANHSLNAVGWSLALVAAALLTIAGASLVRLVPDRPRLTVPALLGLAFGWAGTAAIASGGLVMGDMADSPEREAMVAVLTNFNEGNGNAIFLVVIAGVVGNILLAIALARSGIASRGSAVLFGLGATLSLIGAPGPMKPIAVTGAVMLVFADVLILRGLSNRGSQ